MAEPAETQSPDNPPAQQPASPSTTLPATTLPGPIIDMASGIPYILQFRDKARKDLTTLLTFFNSVHPDIAIALPSAPGQPATPAGPAPSAPASSGSILDRPSVQLGTIGVVVSAVLHQLHVIDPNMAILAGIVSLAATALGPTGVVVGNIVMAMARSAWQSAQATTDAANAKTPDSK